MIESQKGLSMIGWLILAILIILFIILILPLLNQNQIGIPGNLGSPEPTNGDLSEIPTPINGNQATVGEILNDPASFIGQSVTVDSTINSTVGQNAFVLNPDNVDEGLLVVGRGPFSRPDATGDEGNATLSEGDRVQVSGVVRIFSLSEVEQELGISLNEEEFTNYDGRPVVVAEQIGIVQEG
jgi:hypothetical protein